MKATGKKEEKSSEKKAKKLSEEELYRTFYDGYVKEENLQVLQDGYVADYDFNTGYANDLLLSATMEDFGGGGNKAEGCGASVGLEAGSGSGPLFL